MQIIPAIDLKDGKCVRLLKGEEGTETVFSENPAETARKWESCGARWIHVVDLDGAFSGEPGNLEYVIEISRVVTCSLQVGGGIRTLETVRKYIDNGVDRVIIGTAAFNGDGFLEEACAEYPGKIAVGIDKKNGKIEGKGWTEVLDLDTGSVLRKMKDAGVSVILNTNIDRDGTLEGINGKDAGEFINSSPLPVITSGGIATMEDLEILSSIKPSAPYGVILGKSIYTGSIDLKEAVRRYG